MQYHNILVPVLKAVGENKKSRMHFSIHHGHLYANLELLHRIIYLYKNGCRKKWYCIFLELVVDREGSFNTEKGIKMNLPVYLVLTQKLDLNTTFGV